MTAVCKHKNTFSRERLWGIFKQFDVDNSGTITIDDIENALEKWDIDVEPGEIKEMMLRHDSNHDQMIDFDDFLKIFV